MKYDARSILYLISMIVPFDLPGPGEAVNSCIEYTYYRNEHGFQKQVPQFMQQLVSLAG